MTNIQAAATLHNGVAMPWLGLGTFKSRDGDEVRQAVRWALEAGYRHIDTASIYGNEAGVGQAVRESGLPRQDIFITTKVWNSDQGFDQTLRAHDASLRRLGLDYADLYLVHWPVAGRFRDTWNALEKLYADGRVRAIGVSNFLVHHLEELLADARVVPMVNQVEFHPFLRQPGLLEYCRRHRIQLEAWAPLFRGDVGKMKEFADLAGKYRKTAAQLLLRWCLQHEVVTIPKSANRERIRANADIFDFHLDDLDMAALDALDRGLRLGPDPDNFNF
jgi:diketogulonate reductase-like aldo/keto reductase